MVSVRFCYVVPLLCCCFVFSISCNFACALLFLNVIHFYSFIQLFVFSIIYFFTKGIYEVFIHSFTQFIYFLFFIFIFLFVYLFVHFSATTRCILLSCRLAIPNIFSFFYVFIHSFMYSFLIYSFIHLLFICSLTHLFMYSFIRLFIYLLIDLLIYSFIYSCTRYSFMFILFFIRKRKLTTLPRLDYVVLVPI